METFEWPSRFLDLKRGIVSRTTEERLTQSWNDLLSELAVRTAEIAKVGPDYIPQVNFTDLEKMTPEEIDAIRHKGVLVIHGVVDRTQASEWKTGLEEFIKANPQVEGFPESDMQFFLLYWTRQQVEARAHPNILKASAWLSKLYRVKSGKNFDGVDLNVPLTYADRFRIRHPGPWPGWFPPHIDGGSIERWEDETFRRCFDDILNGNWREHDPYELEHRLDARSSLYGRPNQASVLRTFQGWLAMSETAPTQGTLRVFPDVKLSNAYILLRPFFRPIVAMDSPDILDPKNWKFDISTADFPGISPDSRGPGFLGPMPSAGSHPHLRLGEAMTSVPKVGPGDMVFWHCDVIHSVEDEHVGPNDSAVMYIAAVPKTPRNVAYVAKQLETFMVGENPPDYPKASKKGVTYVGLGVDGDIKAPMSRIAMGLPVEVA